MPRTASFHPLPDELPDTFGAIDVYLFDQVLRGRFPAGSRVLDAGCGAGRNLHYFLRAGFEAWGVDLDPAPVREARAAAADLVAPSAPGGRFAVASLDGLPFPDAHFDRVIANAVLHFASGPDHFDALVDELWRVLRPGGLLFARLATSTAIEDQIEPRGNGRYLFPDGTERFLVDDALLRSTTERLGGTLADPLRTVYLHGQRAMATWSVFRLPKPGSGDPA